MTKSEFVTAVKQKLTPDFTGSMQQQVPAVSGGPSTIPPTGGISSQSNLLFSEIARTGGSGVISDIIPGGWWSALQPISPVAPESYRPRQRAFLPGENLSWTPGDDKGGVSFDMLRAMADSFDLVRLVIETRKDQLERLSWAIRLKPLPGEKVKAKEDREIADPNIKKLTDLFLKPDGRHTWRTWLRMWMEDVLVIDAGAINYVRDDKGRIAELMPIDGATVERNISDRGVTPSFPSVAYQQVVYGTPACNFTVRDLQYIMRNERTWRRYGFSAVEQILITMSIALRRQDFLLNYYTAGNIPEALCFLPSNLPVDRIKEIQDWFDSVLAGNLQKRRRLTFLPGYGSGGANENVHPNVVFPKEPLLKDELDEWLMKIVCYAFSVSPQNLMKMINRASAEQSSNVAQEEGLEPSKSLVKDVCNLVITELGFGATHEFDWLEERAVDSLKQAQIDKLLLGNVYTVNEVRTKRGDGLRPEKQADMLGVFSPQGFIPIDQPVVPKAPTSGFGNKTTKVLEPGQYIHPIYGDLFNYDAFFAYDEDTDTILVRGDVDIDLAKAQLKEEGYLK